MAITAPIIRNAGATISYTLPHLSEYTVEDVYRMAYHETAAGTPQRQLLNSTLKHKFTLTWSKLSATNVATLRSAWQLLRDGTCTFIDMDGNSWSVVPDPQQDKLQFEAFASNVTLYYKSKMALITP